jgi:anti-sigma B factor antagonist
MELMCDHLGDVTVVMLAGAQLDASSVGEFKRDIAHVLEEHAQIIFDLSQLGFVDSSGLGSLLACLRQVQERGGDLKLCSMSKSIRALFELVRIAWIFHIFDTQEEAVRAFRQQ